MKTICPIHRYAYSGCDCPFCVKEHKERLEALYAEEISEYSNSVTESDIARLSEKYNLSFAR